MVKTARLTALTTAAAAAAAALFAGAGAFAQESGNETGNEARSECVDLRGVNGYQVIDDQHLVLTGGASRYYLVTTTSRCSGLRFGAQIGTSFGDNARLCPPIVEYVIPDDGWRCAIDTVEEVESLEEAEQRAAAENEG
ncbi:DUF6491 family protein [Maricaulaceae bacterium MS644]